jgi:hypothetical protein
MIGQLAKPKQLAGPRTKQPQVVAQGRARLLQVGGRLLQRQRQIPKRLGELVGGSVTAAGAGTQQRHRLDPLQDLYRQGVAMAAQAGLREVTSTCPRPAGGR